MFAFALIYFYILYIKFSQTNLSAIVGPPMGDRAGNRTCRSSATTRRPVSSALQCHSVKECQLYIYIILQHQNSNMAAPDCSYKKNIVGAESESQIVILADSFLTSDKIKGENISSIGREITLFLSQHENVTSFGPIKTALVTSYAFGGATMNKFLDQKHILKLWGANLPKLTIVNLGGCDIANEAIGHCNNNDIKKEFSDKVKHFLGALRERARAILPSKDVPKFDTDIINHKFLIIGIPKWGPTGYRLKSGGISKDKWDRQRQLANSGLKSNLRSLLVDYNAYYFMPKMDNACYYKIHFTDPSIQVYADQILTVASKLLCSHCQFKMERRSIIERDYRDFLEDKSCSGSSG